MRRKMKGLSIVVAIIISLLIIVALIVAVVYIKKIFEGGILATAILVSNNYAGGNQIVIIDIKLRSTMSVPVNVVAVVANITLSNRSHINVTFGNVNSREPINLPAESTGSIAPLKRATLDGANRVEAGKSNQLTVAFTAPLSTQIISAEFTIYLVDPSGNQKTATTNEVDLTR